MGVVDGFYVDEECDGPHTTRGPAVLRKLENVMIGMVSTEDSHKACRPNFTLLTLRPMVSVITPLIHPALLCVLC